MVKIGNTLPKFYWLNGSPGCGKTHMIMRNYGPEVVVLTATTAGKDDVWGALAAAGHEVWHELVRTVALAVMNPHKVTRAKTILVGEATMIHPGQIVFFAASAAETPPGRLFSCTGVRV